MQQKSIKNYIKYFSIIYAIVLLPMLHFNLSIGGLYLEGKVMLGAKDPNSHSFRIEVPTLEYNNVFFHAQNQFVLIVKWAECLREPYLIIYMLLRILPYLLFFIQLYYLYKLVEKLEIDVTNLTKLIGRNISLIGGSYLVSEFLLPIAEHCKIAFFQKHIYFEESLWHHTVATDKLTSFNLFFIGVLAVLGILFYTYVKGETLKKENDTILKGVG